MHLEYEGKTDSSLVFREFLLRQDSEICPVGGEIVFENGVVECRVHSVNEEDNNDEDGEVPYL